MKKLTKTKNILLVIFMTLLIDYKHIKHIKQDVKDIIQNG